MKKIAVIGSLNIDLVSRVPAFTKPGETQKGLSFDVFMGGKGGNQAVAASRLVSGVRMLGRLGDDQHGKAYARYLEEQGLLMDSVEITPGIVSGTAVIEVDAGSGDNRIIYHAGANLLLDDRQVQRHWDKLLEHDIFLFQLETPLDTVFRTMEKLYGEGKTVILDPAPAAILHEGFLRCASFLTPNETELSILSGMPTDSAEHLMAAGAALLQQGANAVIVKAGRQGAFYLDGQQRFHAEGFPVQAVDTTAAGDSFNAGFAAALSRGEELHGALRYANAVAALSTLGAGAQPAMPKAQDVEGFIASRTR